MEEVPQPSPEAPAQPVNKHCRLECCFQPHVPGLMAMRKALTALSYERPGLWGGPASCCVTVM